MSLPVPSQSTAAAGAKILASEWNSDVRDAVDYLVALQGGTGRRNALTNSHFDIWQAGTTATIPTGGTGIYLADQWVAYRNAAGATVSQQTGPTGQKFKMRVQRNAANTSTTALKICQPIESRDSLSFAGQSASLRLTLAAGANFSAAASTVTIRVEYGTGTDQNPISGFTGTADALSTTQVITTTPTDYTFDNIAIPDTATQLAVWVEWIPVGTAGAADFVEISAGQLSVGSAAGYERLPISQTRDECQHYYWQWGPGVDVSNIANGNCSGTTTADFILDLPTTMRTPPTVTFSADNDFSTFVGTATNTTAMSQISPTSRSDAVFIRATVASGLTVGHAVYLRNTQDPTNAAIYVNARL